ncbi:hypothetical protein ACFQ4Q_24035, partial [Lysobacter gummosus]|uniref:hypothetical protein n=1 Tax=Lysobacter gummosus TaxID=262324 RepID=UPI00364358DB
SHARVGHRQGLYPKTPQPSGCGVFLCVRENNQHNTGVPSKFGVSSGVTSGADLIDHGRQG